MTDTTRTIASLSLDLDNQWTYMKTHGDAGWQRFPSYLDVVAPRILAILRERRITITFFIVGQDAVLPVNRRALESITAAGHEIANHSFRHEPWLHLYSESELETEMDKTERALAAFTGEAPRGFRGPGYSLSETVLKVLKRRGYAYDASTLPTYIGPLARAYYFRSAKLSAKAREERKLLFGQFADGLRPLKPYLWRISGGVLPELPVTTMPGARIPFHVSYLIFLANRSPALAKAYFRTALKVCDLAGVQPSLLLHPLDVLGSDDVGGLAFFPGMSMTSVQKIALLGELLDEYASRYRIVTMAKHVESFRNSMRLPIREPRFSNAVVAGRPAA